MGGINPYTIEHRRNLSEDEQDVSPKALLERVREFDYPSLLKKLKGKEPRGCDLSDYRSLLRFGEKFKENDFLQIVELVKDDLRELKELLIPCKKS